MRTKTLTGALGATLLALACGGSPDMPAPSVEGGAPSSDAVANPDAHSSRDLAASHDVAALPDAAALSDVAAPLDVAAPDAGPSGPPAFADLQGAWVAEPALVPDGGAPAHVRLRIDGDTYFEVVNNAFSYCGESGSVTLMAGNLSLVPARSTGGCRAGVARTGAISWTATGLALALPTGVVRYTRARDVPKMFVTIERHDGNFAGDTALPGANAIAKADAFCQQSIARPDGRTYKALLVDGTHRSAVPARDWVLRPDTTYYQADGVLNVFRSTPQALAQSSANNAVLSDHDRDRYSWIGLEPSFKTRPGANSCEGWTTSDKQKVGGMGNQASAQFVFGFNVSAACDYPDATLLCVSQ